MAIRITPSLIEESGSKIRELGCEYLDKINLMYSKIDEDLHQYWSGDTYNAFQQTFASYKEDLNSLGVLLRDNYYEALHNISSQFNNTASELIDIANSARK